MDWYVDENDMMLLTHRSGENDDVNVREFVEKISDIPESSIKAVNSDAFYVRYAHYNCAGYGWRWNH